MIRRRNKSSIIYSVFFVLLTSFSCQNKVSITRSYIYSTGWEKGGYQGFRIAKIKLNDSTISVFDKNFNHYFLDEHTIDSSFCFGAGGNSSNTKATKKMSKIYFDRESVYYIWYKCWNITETYRSIGLLELDTWYIIEGLQGTEDFYVYIDKEGKSHSYSSGPQNW
jgi:hypothetical protein